MNQQELIQRITAKEEKIKFYKNEIMQYRHYFSQLRSIKWKKVIPILSLFIPVLMGMKLGKSKGKMGSRVIRYGKIMALTIFTHFQNRFLTSVYFHLEKFIKNKFRGYSL